MIKFKNLVNTPKGVTLAVSGGVLLLLILAAAYITITSPLAITSPKLEHAHIRMQIISGGKAVDLGDDKYQESYEKGSCSADLPQTPIHLHDNKNQFVHLHWKRMTGGMVLKNYGWNFVGGSDSLLGYRLDKLPRVEAVPIYGSVLPNMPDEADLWVYTGSADQYEQRTQSDFISQDLETFFGKKSTINPDEFSLLDILSPRAYAHDGEHESASSEGKTDEKEQARIQNLLGNVVVFVQDNQPTKQQIQKQFNNLEPLSDSTCGG